MWSLLLSGLLVQLAAVCVFAQNDPCAKIAGKAFVTPADATACQKAFPFNETLRQNVLTNVARVFDFYTFEDYYLDSPPPFQDSTRNIRAELDRINKTDYETDYDFSWDLYTFTTQLQDGHTRWFPDCYTSFQNILPAPVASLEIDGEESLFISPDSVEFISLLGDEYTGFFDSIGFDWKRLAGAKVLEIEGKPAYDYVAFVAETVSGNFLDLGVRFSSVYTSYRISGGDFSQRLGDLAGPTGTVLQNLTFNLITQNSTDAENVTVPYLANFIGNPFTDKESFWANNCAATNLTNGVDLKGDQTLRDRERLFPVGMILDKTNATGIALPDQFRPNLTTTPGSDDILRPYVLPGNNTGVLFVGSFAPADFFGFQDDVVSAVNAIKESGATQLIVDLTNNGGGFICLGQFLHKFIVGSRLAEGPGGNPGFVSTNRANPLAQKAVAEDIKFGLDSTLTFYSADNWAFLNNTQMPPSFNYIDPSVPLEINGQQDATSQRFLDTCELSFTQDIPEEPAFDLNNIVIVGNSWCASTCAMYSTLMNEHYNTTIINFGAKPGNVREFKDRSFSSGNQVLEWADLDTELKTAGVKDDPLAPPDLLVSGNMRVNWRTAWSFLDEQVPIAYLSELAKERIPYTLDTFMSPQNLWTFVESQFLD